jgi:hypothetical protein
MNKLKKVSYLSFLGMTGKLPLLAFELLRMPWDSYWMTVAGTAAIALAA